MRTSNKKCNDGLVRLKRGFVFSIPRASLTICPRSLVAPVSGSGWRRAACALDIAKLRGLFYQLNGDGRCGLRSLAAILDHNSVDYLRVIGRRETDKP